MAELASITALAKLLSNGRKILNDLSERNLANEHKKAVSEAIAVVSEANDSLFELQSSMIELQQSNVDLAKQIAERNTWDARIAEYQLITSPVGGIVLAKGEPLEHYACPVCAENLHQIHALQDDQNYAGTFSCPNCEKSYSIRPIKPIEYPKQGGWT